MQTAEETNRCHSAQVANMRDYLAQFRGREVAYFPNPGNAGDSVIAAATYQQLRASGVRHREPSPVRFDPTGQVVFYGGGGNLVGMDTFSARILRKLHRNARHLTVLPHTIKDIDPLLEEFGSNVTLICRERVSYDYVRRQGRCDALLMDDMAFGLDVDALLHEASGFNAPLMLADFLAQKLLGQRAHTSFDNVKRYLNPGSVAAELRARPGGGIFNAFRLDGEATDIGIPADNVDLSSVFMYGVSPMPVAVHAARALIETLRRFDTVRTNRLHVAISAGLLGKRVEFHANNYYKCQAVYDFSMRGRLPNIIWMG